MAEAPGETEDSQGRPLVGPCGVLVKKELGALGLDLDRDCWRTNAVRCRPPENREPKDPELRTCREFWLKEVQERRPRVVLLLGGVALSSWMDGRWRKDLGGISRWRGFSVPDRLHGCWVVPTYHPSFLLRHGGRDEDPAALQFRSDLALAARLLKRPVPEFQEEASMVRILENPMEAVRFLRSIREGAVVAIDYETTGIKPHAAGHRIVSCAVSAEPESATAFLMDDRRVSSCVAALVSNPAIRKVAANISFEQEWSRVILGAEGSGWAWDTMVTAHVLDSRTCKPGICSLKFQAAVRWGLLDYDSEVEPFLSSGEESANAKNRIEQLPAEKLLVYNGIDALLERRLWSEQVAELRRIAE